MMVRADRDQIEAREAPGTEGAEGALVRKLAHELNSLLDGSMRCLTLVQRALDPGPGLGPGAEAAQDVLGTLDLARSALRQMAELLDRAMDDPARGVAGAVATPGTLEEAVGRILGLLGPFADESGVEIAAHLDVAARPLPGGPLGALITNAMRNAVEACARSASASRRVELCVTVAGDELRVLVLDNGPGLRADESDRSRPGRGLGLGTCQEIVRSLGGRCRLSNVPFGRGALFEACVPIQGLSGA